jgi:type 1 glutamine amidotransferase
VSPTRVLLVTGGHPFDRDAFLAVFDDRLFDDVEVTHIEHPDALAILTADGTAGHDVLVMYDMPGIEFTRGDPPARFVAPPPEVVEGYAGLLEAGRGMVFLHHAIASWPAWPDFAEIVGGRFHYQPAQLGGRAWPDSGYRFDVTHTVEVLEPDHPLAAGLPDVFEITDELYLFPVLAEQVVPVMRSRHRFVDSGFYSADRAIRGERDSRAGWSHPPGSDLVAWVKHAANSPVAYVQFGDGPGTYADPAYRRAVANAVAWAASPTAHQWARQRHAAPAEEE